MTDFYSNLAATAKRLLASKGQNITLSRTTPGTYNETTGIASETTTDVTLSGVVIDFGAGVTTVRGTLVQATDKQVLLEAKSGVTPSVDDSVIVGADTYVVVSVGQINPAGTAVMYDLHVRK